MQARTTIGFDIAKSVCQVHGVDTVGHVIIRRQLKRRQVIGFFQKLPACLVGSFPACCARAASGQAAAAPPRSLMNCRRLMRLSAANDSLGEVLLNFRQ